MPPHRPSRRCATAPSGLLRSLVLLAALLSRPLAAQRWSVRTDDGSPASTVRVVAAGATTQIITGPAAVLADTTQRGTGNWRLEATLTLFEPGGRAEGFGVIFGGTGLLSPAQRYGYALVRRDGRAMLKVRNGGTTQTVRDWTVHAGVPVWRGGVPGQGLRYPLVVEANGPRVTVMVGGTVVLDAARSELPTDGVVGLRVNHALHIAVERFTLTPLPSTR